MKKQLATLAVCCVAGSALAGTITTPCIAGGFQGWDASANPMTETSEGSDIWTATFTGLSADTRYEFKVTDGTWDNAFPSANSWLYTDGDGSVTITYDGNTYDDGWSASVDRIGVSVDPGTWTVAGSFLSQIGGADWSESDAAGAMTSVGGGIYMLTANNLAAGTYEWKSVLTGSWDAISGDTRSINAGNSSFTTTETDNDVTIYLDAVNGVVKTEVIPEPATFGLIGFAGLSLLAFRRKFKS